MQGAESDEGKPVDDVEHLAWTPLHITSSQGHDAAIPLLVAAGCDVNAQDAEGATSLHLTARNGHVRASFVLLQQGADPSILDKEGRSALELAQNGGHVQVIKLLQELSKPK